MNQRFLVLIASHALTLPVCAQSFNVDASSFGSLSSLPPATYAGPALSPGAWNNFSSPVSSANLLAVDGTSTTVYIDNTIGCPAGPQYCDDPGTSSPDDLLLDDFHMCDASSTDWGFNNLANGQYVVYTIVFRPCASPAPIRVSVFGSSDPDQTLAATWSGSYALGVNYARHAVNVTGGGLSLSVWNPVTGTHGALCGVQIVKTDAPPLGEPQCFGDGSATSCPCANNGQSGRGCQNSAVAGGALLYATGAVGPDTVVLQAYGELPSALSIFLQGNATLIPAVNFGDGLRCAGGILKRLYVKNASGGFVSAPGPGDPSVSQQSANLGDPIPPGERRYYQVYYRDANVGFCPDPPGSTFNVTNALKIIW